MKSVFSVLLLGLFAALPLHAQVPALMSYQGRVTDASGTPIGNTTPANRTVTFKFYSTSTGGTPVYAEAQTVTISGGEFSVLIGNGTGVSGFHGPSAPALTPYTTLPGVMTGTLYLGLTVDDGTSAADPEITPRQQIVSAAYAFRAKYAEGLLDNTLSTSMLQSSSVTTTKILDANITTSKLADANVTTAKIQDGNVTTAKLADGSVTTAKIASGAIDGARIADGSIGNADLADNVVNSAKITDGDVRSIDIADGNVTTADLADSAVTTAKIAGGAIDYNRLAAALQQALCPPGTILAYGGDSAPAGWILCDGTALNRNTYSALFAVVGTRFGYGDSSNFRVPDLRGRFLRGRDGGVGRDDDRNSRSAMNSGGATGDAVGSVQDDQLRSHNHYYNDIYYSESGGDSSIYNNSRGSGDTDYDNEPWQIGRYTNNTGGNETRPENANVNYIIKY